MGVLEGKVAIVTGAARGTGSFVARRFAAEGARVAVADVLDDLGKEIVGELGAAAMYVHLDVTDEASWRKVPQRVVDSCGRLDVLVNNAGMGDLAPIEETTKRDWDRTIAIDQTGVFLGMKVCGDALKASGHGSVINISSIFGTSGGFGVSPTYHAAKGAVRTLTKNVALHWATEGVRVNSVHPGFIRTPILDQAKGTEVWEAMTAMTPMGRLGEPEEIAAAVAYLASDDASFVTGLELYVDGGYIAR